MVGKKGKIDWGEKKKSLRGENDENFFIQPYKNANFIPTTFFL